MRQNVRIIGQQNAIEFAKKNCTVDAEYYIKKATDGVSWYQKAEADKFKTLVIEGYSELVDLFKFSVYPENKFKGEPEHYALEDPRIVLRIIGTGETLYVQETYYHSKKFAVYFDDSENYNLRLKGFTFGEPHPNYIGTGNVKKIEAWLDWLRKKRQAQIDYDANGRKLNKEFQDAVAAHFPDCYMRIADDGWMSECEFKKDGVEYSYSAHDNGRFSRNTKLDYDAVKPTRELIGIDA